MFENRRLFNARRHGSNTTLFIDSPGPVADIFYLLQILAPGMFLIIRVDDYDDRGDVEPEPFLQKDGSRKINQFAGMCWATTRDSSCLAIPPLISTRVSAERGLMNLTWTTMVTTPMPRDLRNWKTLRLVIQNAGTAVVAIIRRAGIEN